MGCRIKKLVSRVMIVNKGNDGIPVVVAWRRQWDAKSDEGSVADWLISTKEEEGIQLLLHCDGQWDAKSIGWCCHGWVVGHSKLHILGVTWGSV